MMRGSGACWDAGTWLTDGYRADRYGTGDDPAAFDLSDLMNGLLDGGA